MGQRYSLLQKISGMAGDLREIASLARGWQLILIESQLNSAPRYGYGKQPHARLYEVIAKNRHEYQNHLETVLALEPFFMKIPVKTPGRSLEPCWSNFWLPPLDSMSLYAFLCIRKPRRYLEIGSGYSTKFARRAIGDHGLHARIASIDPHPRTNIDAICDTVIRRCVEDVDLSVFEELDRGDILFVDGSHRCFMNSDVTVLFMDILPRLRAGVLLHLHDIFLPYDYPPSWRLRYYSEQYLLAVHILADPDGVDIALPNAFINQDRELSQILSPLLDHLELTRFRGSGGSFWFTVN